MTIEQLSQEICVGIDTLRIWERRYGFPIPDRDARGHRSYSQKMVEQLWIVKRLQILGHRPGKIFRLTSEERLALLETCAGPETLPDRSLLQLVTDLPADRIDRELRKQLNKLGLSKFIHHFCCPLLQAFDHSWSNGLVSIAREHIISDCLELLLREQIALELPRDKPTKLLFLTLNGERHKLGLLLAAALFHSEGIDWILINEELPISEISPLTQELQVDGVALSFSCHCSPRQVKRDLASLRKLLDPRLPLIAGGAGIKDRGLMPNLTTCNNLEEIPKICRKLFR